MQLTDGENYYSTSEGLLELRQEIAKKENAKGLSISADEILVTNGVSEGLRYGDFIHCRRRR